MKLEGFSLSRVRNAVDSFLCVINYRFSETIHREHTPSLKLELIIIISREHNFATSSVRGEE